MCVYVWGCAGTWAPVCYHVYLVGRRQLATVGPLCLPEGPGDQTQAGLELGGKLPCPLSHLASLYALSIHDSHEIMGGEKQERGREERREIRVAYP